VRGPLAGLAGGINAVDAARREHVDGLVVVVQRKPELLHVVDALRAASGLASRLNRRQQQGDQNRDDGDHDQQLDQRESPTRAAASWEEMRMHQCPLR